jgi:4-amino-4-deoxy-L-arabinose transferase-like glycosyltransferase
MLDNLKRFGRKLVENKYTFAGLLVIIISLSRVGTWFYPFENDHLFFYVIGREISQGQVLYLDIWDHKPPLIFYFNALLHWILGGSVFWHRIFFALWLIPELILLYKLFKTILNRLKLQESGFWAKVGLLFYAFWRNLSQFAYGGNNTENFGLIFLIGSYLSYLHYQEKPQIRWLLLSGLCLSFMVFLKPNFILLSLPIWVDLASGLIGRIWRKNWTGLGPALLGTFGQGLVFLSPTLLQAVLWIGYFYSQGALREFWLASYQFNTDYIKVFDRIGAVTHQTLFILINLPLNFLLFGSFLILAKQQASQLPLNKALLDRTIRFVGFMGLSALLFSLFFGWFFSYYYLIIMPILVLIITIITARKKNSSETHPSLPKQIKLTDFSYWKKVFWKQAILAIYLFFFLFSLAYFPSYLDGSKPASEQEIKEIANYLNQQTGQDKSFYSLTYGATFYYLTEKSNVSRYISINIFKVEEILALDYKFNEQLIKDLEADKTDYVVIYTPDYFKLEQLNGYLAECYTEDKRWTNFVVLQRQECSLENI